MSPEIAGPAGTVGPVLVAVVGTASAEAALRHAFGAADDRGVALHVVATGATPVRYDVQLFDLIDRWAEKYPTVAVETRVRRTIDPVVVLVAASAGCGLLVAPHPSDVSSSAVVEALSRRAHCPVVIAGD